MERHHKIIEEFEKSGEKNISTFAGSHGYKQVEGIWHDVVYMLPMSSSEVKSIMYVLDVFSNMFPSFMRNPNFDEDERAAFLSRIDDLRKRMSAAFGNSSTWEMTVL